jgi:type II secretory pathway pseudopilin PulG
MSKQRVAQPEHGLLPAFTLIEVLIASAISVIVTGLLVMTLAQFFRVSAETTNRLTLLGDLSLASQALTHDINGATSVVLANAHRLDLVQTDPQGGPARTVVYTVAPPLLVREGSQGEQTIARNVAGGTAFSPAGSITGTQLVTIRLVVAAGDDTLEMTIQCALRSQP